MKPHVKQQIIENHDRMKKAGHVHRLPNGQLGTVLKCPYPGCDESGVEGWSSCGGHFNEVHEAFTAPVSPLSRFSVAELQAELDRRRSTPTK